MPILLQSSLIRLHEASEAAIARVGVSLKSEFERLVADGDLELYGKFCRDVEAEDDDDDLEQGENELISWSQIAGQKWNWALDSITITKSIEKDGPPIQHITGFSDVSFKRDEFQAQLDRADGQRVPDKRRGPRPKFDPDLIKDLLDSEDTPRGEKTQGELARALVDNPILKKAGLKEAYAEKLVRKFRDT